MRPGDRLWKTDDPELDKRLRQSFAGDVPRFQRPVDVAVHGHVGAPLTLIIRDHLGNVVQLDSASPLAAADQRPLTTEKLTEQLGRLGGTPFRLEGFANHLEGGVILPVSELNRSRREAVARLEALRGRPKRWQTFSGDKCVLIEKDVAGVAGVAGAAKNGEPSQDAGVLVLVRNLAQLDAALSAGVDTLYCDFEDPKGYREAVRRFHAWSEPGSVTRSIFVAPPRVFKTGEEWILKQVRSSEADGYLVRNHDHLQFFAGQRCVGDFSLNVANPLTAAYFMERYRLERLTASYDLNASQLEGLLGGAPPRWFEVTIHQHMPMFHMEHCVFCAFLSAGTDYRNCGRPCDKQEVRLRDRVGLEHPLKADAGCRNTVFNARAQTGAESVERLQALGARHFRLEFVHETPETVGRTIARYQALLRHEITGAELWRELKLHNQLGVTRGQMEGEEARKVFPRRG